MKPKAVDGLLGGIKSSLDKQAAETCDIEAALAAKRRA